MLSFKQIKFFLKERAKVLNAEVTAVYLSMKDNRTP